ncbi:PDR/VanB family oxidoreductase [Burkholderia stagnalis]
MSPDLFPVVLTSIRRLSPTIHEFRFEREEGGRLPAYTAGAHIDVVLPTGLTRQFSLLEPYGSGHTYRIAVKRGDPGRGGSRYLHDSARVGATFQIGYPRNSFPLEETTAHVALIAGGIGVTPLWCMAQRRMELGRPWHLWYAVQTRREIAFQAELAPHAANVTTHVDEENGGERLDLKAIVSGLTAGTHVYCCGPEPMLAAFEASTAHLADTQVHVEHFAPPMLNMSTEQPVVLRLAKSGKELQVAAGQSMLDAVLAAGVNVPYSCQAGVCGACEVKVIEGQPDHRDQFLTQRERAAGSMMLCCSRSRSHTLTLDL